MTQRHPFSFMLPEDLPAKILGIPYKNNGLQMFVLLPDDIDGLEKVRPHISLSLPLLREVYLGELIHRALSGYVLGSAR